jgi:uncharacterized membrane protein YagU involved in acid resistance
MPRMNRRPAWAWIALGGLAIGTLDLLFAWGFWVSKGATFIGILQSIAAGWYGKASHSMGATSAWVGALSHYAIATAFVAAYWLAARRLPALLRRPVMLGALYGLLLYLIMNFVVLPLSAAGMPRFDNVPWVASSILAHMIFGLLSALVAVRASGRQS